MTLAEGVKLQGRPAIISGCNRRMLAGFFKDLGFKVGAEVGVYQGKFSEEFCKVGLKTYSIDPWLAYDYAGRVARNQLEQTGNYEKAVARLAPYGELSVIIRKTSADALDDFRDGSLDFVYIDGNHEFSYFAFDLYEWNRKLKKGGILCGHDYFNTPKHATGTLCHVKAAVDAYTELYEIPNWWVIAHTPRRLWSPEHSKDDRYPSFMWFKS